MKFLFDQVSTLRAGIEEQRLAETQRRREDRQLLSLRLRVLARTNGNPYVTNLARACLT
jgi:hypothetical protein